MKNGEISPGGRAAAWTAAFLLSLFLTALAGALPAAYALASRSLHERIALSDQVLDAQMENVQKKIRLIAGQYGFSHETVSGLADRESMRRMNLLAVDWWLSSLENGRAAERLEWDRAALEQALLADERFCEGQDGEERLEQAAKAADTLGKVLEREALPLRQDLTAYALKEAGERLDLIWFLGLARRLPLLFALLSVLTAGVICLMNARVPALAGKYLGAACGAAGILSAACGLLWIALNPGQMIGESNARLAVQYRMLENAVWPIFAAEIVLLCVAAVVLLIRQRRREAS